MNKKMLGLLGAGHAITDIHQGALPIVLTFMQPLFGLSQLQVGLAVLALNISSSVIQPAFGVLSDRFRAAWLVPLGCLTAGLGMALTGFSRSYQFLLLAVFLSGLGIAAYHPEGSKFARVFSGERKASGMSLFSVGGNIGFAVGPLLASLFYELAGPKGTLWFLAINGAMSLPLWAALPRLTAEPVIGGAAPVRQEHGTTSMGGVKTGPGKIAPRAIAALVLLVLVVAALVMYQPGHGCLPAPVLRSLPAPKPGAGGNHHIGVPVGGGSRHPGGGPLADRLGLKTIIIGSMAGLAPLLYLFTLSSGIWSVIVVALAGFVVVCTFAITVVFGQELLPNNVGLASGLTLGFGLGLGGVGVTLLGGVADHFGLPAVFHVMVLFPLAGLLFALFLPGRVEIKKITSYT